MGRNYYFFNFNDTTTPHPVPGKVYDPASVDFWLNHMAEVERAARAEANDSSDIGGFGPFTFAPNVFGLKTVQRPESGLQKPNPVNQKPDSYSDESMSSNSTPSTYGLWDLWAALTVLVLLTFVLAVLALALSVVHMCWAWRRRRVDAVEAEEMQVLRRACGGSSASGSLNYMF